MDRLPFKAVRPRALGRGLQNRNFRPKGSRGRPAVQTLESRLLLAANVVLSEIMYHPAGGDVRQEYVELYNRGDAPADLAGWKFTKGITYSFDGGSLAAGAYLVVAADTAVFAQNHPGVSNVVGPWVGQLSNSHEEIKLQDAAGTTVADVTYADEGDWAVRRRGPLDHGHQGWIWVQPADGTGPSLELIDPALPNSAGQNWSSSRVSGGTPGGPNTVADADIAPLILDLAQTPVIPRSTDSVTITARLIDELGPVSTAALHYRVDSATPPSFSTLAMHDDGTAGDAVAGDSIWTAVLPPRNDKTIVEYYVSANDGAQTRTYPGPTDTGGTQGANALYQVDDSTYGGNQTLVKLIMTEKERAELASIGAPGSTSRDSDAQMNGTFIGVDSHGPQIRYNIGIRNRGGGSRTAQPNNYRVNFASDRTWRDVRGINLNGQYSMEEVAGSAVLRMAGVQSQDVQPVQVRVNGANLASTTQFDMFGSYSLVEVEDSDMAENHFPTDPNGNYYRGVDPQHNADLRYLGTNPTAYQTIYPKRTNTDFQDYADLIDLTKTLDPTQTSDADFFASIGSKIDVDQWLRYFAANSLIGNEETSLATGSGDDFSLYAGVNDPRFKLIAHDLDTILGRGDSPAKVNPNESLFTAANRATIGRFLKSPLFAPRYYAQLTDLINTTFSPAQIGATLDNALRDYVPQSVIDTMKTFAANRVAGALAQIPRTLTATTSLIVQNGYPRTTGTTAALSGAADVLGTNSVSVNGVQATYVPWQGTWSAPNVPLNPGINRVLVRSFNSIGKELQRTYVDIWRDTGTMTNVTGTLPANTLTRWTVAKSPYHVTGTLTVPSGATLQIDPGVSVFFDSGAGLVVNGTLRASGTETNRIRFTRTPTSTGRWSGIRFVYSTALPTPSRANNQLSFADFEYDDNGSEGIFSANAKLTIDHVIWAHHSKQYLNINDTALALRDSVLPTVSSAELVHYAGFPSDGYAIFERDTFGSTTGYNDIIDLTGGKRPGPIAQFLNNTFLGGSDDGLDLDATDAQIEGNVFMHFHQDAPRESKSHAISTGVENGVSSNVVITRNYFYDVDHAIIIKDGSFGTITQNTIVNVHKLIPDATSAAINLYEPRQGQFPAVGVFLDGNIFQDIPRLFENPVTPGYTTTISVNHSDFPLIPGEAQYPGVGNIHEDPRLLNTTKVTDPRVDFRLRPGSPAIGSGPNGRDMGAAVPQGASISGEPVGTTYRNNATLQVGGKDLYAYRYRVNFGEWSAEIPVTNPGTASAVVPPIQLTDLPDGTYTVYVEGKNSAGVWQPDDLATASRTWTVDHTYARLLINEVLADNQTAVNVGGAFPDLIELFNDSATARDLSGLSITDDPAVPAKFVFPAGTTIESGQYLTLYADHAAGGSGIHVGFGLSSDGESLYLYDAAANGGTLLDSVSFGHQLPDLSIGRLPKGGWGLTDPTLGAANVAHRTGDTSTLKINEWSADGVSPFVDDFVELYNRDPLPVDLGGLYLSDNPNGWPDRVQIAPLSFIAGSGYLSLTADGKTEPGHVAFHLSREQGMIGLSDASLRRIDTVLYGLQRLGESEGRSPDGGPLYAFFTPPSPDQSNAVMTAISNVPLRITEIMYHPASPKQPSTYTDKDLEFLEFQNVGTDPIDLAGIRLTVGVNFTFPQQTLAPGQYVLLVSNRAAFESVYGTGLPVAGEYTGSLDNGGERVRLEDATGATILDFAYGDDDWYPSTDGDGRSLVIVDPHGTTSTWGTAAAWRPSNRDGGSPGADDAPVPQFATVVSRHVVYKNSPFDSGGADDAVATDKSALLPGGAISFANVTSYSRGINGIEIELDGPIGSISAADFAFLVGTGGDPATWVAAADPLSVTLLPPSGDGHAKVQITWADGAIKNTWLQVTLLANADTHLAANDVFYFGNLVGDAGDAGPGIAVTASDLVKARNAVGQSAAIDIPQDFNRDGVVNAADLVLARNAVGRALAPIGASTTSASIVAGGRAAFTPAPSGTGRPIFSRTRVRTDDLLA